MRSQCLVNNALALLLPAIVSLGAIGCASSKPGGMLGSPDSVSSTGNHTAFSQMVHVEGPKCYQRESDDEYLIGKATARSRDPQMATSVAKDEARVDLAKQLEIQAQAMFKSYREETGDGDGVLAKQVQTVAKLVVSRTLVAARVTCSELYFDPANNRYQSYAVVQVPMSEARATLQAAVREAETRQRASGAFDELSDEIEKLEGR